MLSRTIVPLALALALVSSQSLAANVRSSPIKIGSAGVNSIAAAARAVPPSGTGDDGSMRDLSREQKQEAMLGRLISDIRARTTAQASQAPLALPRVPGLRLGEDESAFGFKGLSNVDQASVNQGFSTEPPDQALCVGNGFIFEGVNSAFAVYTEKGRLVAGPAQANAFFGVDFSLNVSDPKCIYDAPTDRWFVTMTEYDSTFSSNHIMIAVSQTGDPSGSFNIYSLDVTNDGSDFLTGDCPCLGDQPLIGADANGLYISTNAFGVFSYEGAQIYALSKAQLAKGSATVNGVHFDQLSSVLPADEFSASIQPSTTPPGAKFASNTEYLAQSMLAHKAENRLAVWTINNTSALNSNPFNPSGLSMSLAMTPSQVYVQPVPARQKVGPTPLAEVAAIDDFAFAADEQSLDGNDQRMSQVMYLNGTLWTAVGTASTTDGAPVRDAVAWFALTVSNGTSGLKASVAAQGYVAGPDNSHLIYPAMAVNANGEAAMVFTLTGPQFFPSAAFWKFGTKTLHMLAEGKAPQDGFSAYYFGRPRWGDYSTAAVGQDGTIWMATEMIPGGVRKKFANWGTFIGRTRSGEQDD